MTVGAHRGQSWWLLYWWQLLWCHHCHILYFWYQNHITLKWTPQPVWTPPPPPLKGNSSIYSPPPPPQWVMVALLSKSHHSLGGNHIAGKLHASLRGLLKLWWPMLTAYHTNCSGQSGRSLKKERASTTSPWRTFTTWCTRTLHQAIFLPTMDYNTILLLLKHLLQQEYNNVINKCGYILNELPN